MKQLISTAAVALTLSLAQPGRANAAEIHVWTARAIATVLAEIGTTGHHLDVYSGLRQGGRSIGRPACTRMTDARPGRAPSRIA